MAFVISLDKPIRQGQQKYQHLVLRTTKVRRRRTAVAVSAFGPDDSLVSGHTVHSARSSEVMPCPFVSFVSHLGACCTMRANLLSWRSLNLALKRVAYMSNTDSSFDRETFQMYSCLPHSCLCRPLPPRKNGLSRPRNVQVCLVLSREQMKDIQPCLF